MVFIVAWSRVLRTRCSELLFRVVSVPLGLHVLKVRADERHDLDEIIPACAVDALHVPNLTNGLGVLQDALALPDALELQRNRGVRQTERGLASDRQQVQLVAHLALEPARRHGDGAHQAGL